MRGQMISGFFSTRSNAGRSTGSRKNEKYEICFVFSLLRMNFLEQNSEIFSVFRQTGFVDVCGFLLRQNRFELVIYGLKRVGYFFENLFQTAA
jgi:hypothetical protein